MTNNFGKKVKHIKANSGVGVNFRNIASDYLLRGGYDMVVFSDDRGYIETWFIFVYNGLLELAKTVRL